ncbi:hypothetical protein [Clostridium yunnanense]|nr:hypothetical protein [Clostridium yunnanense]
MKKDIIDKYPQISVAIDMIRNEEISWLMHNLCVPYCKIQS